jgi:hypothetical protein
MSSLTPFNDASRQSGEIFKTQSLSHGLMEGKRSVTAPISPVIFFRPLGMNIVNEDQVSFFFYRALKYDSKLHKILLRSLLIVSKLPNTPQASTPT